MSYERLLVVLNENQTIKACAAYDVAGVPADITTTELETIIEGLGDAQELASLREQVATLEEQIVASVPEEPDTPISVTMAQARIALKQAGLFDQVEAGLNALPEGDQKDTALIAWEYAPNVARNGALVTALAATMGLTDEQLDELFVAAKTIIL